MWTIPKRRRALDGEAGKNFIGAEHILPQIGGKKAQTPTTRMRIALTELKSPARAGMEIVSEDGTKIGHVTSSGFGPTVGKPIAMG